MPDYYEGKGGMQPFDVIDAFGLDFYEGNIVKYVIRWRRKDGVQDLHKARRYIDELIKRAEDGQPPALVVTGGGGGGGGGSGLLSVTHGSGGAGGGHG